jgi:hypothetical protein
MKRNQIEHSLPILILFSVVFLFFYRTLNFELLSWDDYELIKWNDSLRGFSLAHLKEWITTPYLKSYIPITMASFAVDVFLWGDSVQGFRITNLLLHFFNSCFVYIILFRVSKSKLLALFLTLIFILHPVQVESVLWVSQRKTLLFSFFFLLGFITIFKEDGRHETDKAAQKKLFYFLCFILSMLSKPTAAAIVFVVPMYFFLYQPRRIVIAKPFYLLFSILVIYIAYLSFSLFPSIFKDNFSVGFYDFFLKRIFSFFVYFLEFFFPGNSGMHRIPYGDYLNMGYRLWTMLIYYGSICILCFYGWRRKRELLFWCGWFFVWLFPLINTYVTPYGDRHLYLPIMGILALGGFIFSKFKKMGCILILLSLIGFIPNTYARLNIWKNSETFLTDMLSVKPNDYDAAMSLAGFYEDHGRKVEAQQIYWKQMMNGQSNLPYAFLNCYNLLLHSEPKDERLIRITRRHFKRKYDMELKDVYQRLLSAKKNHEPINPIIDEILAKV